MKYILKETQLYTFEIDNVRINSIQRNNDDVKYNGLSDTSGHSSVDDKVSDLTDIPITI